MTGKCNILFVDSGSGWGGTASYLYNLLKSINRERIIPTVLFYLESRAPNIRKISDLGIQVLYLPKIKNYFYMGESAFRSFRIMNSAVNLFLSSLIIMKLIVQNNIKMVFLNNDVFYHLPAVFVAKLLRRPLICRKAGYGRGRLLQRMLSKYVDLFICECEATKKDLLENDVRFKQIETLYLGIDLAQYNIAAKKKELLNELNVSQENIIIGSISRFEEGKGQKELVYSACELLGHYKNISFLLVGDYVDNTSCSLNDLKSSIPESFKENIIFLGWKDNVQEMLNLIHIFVHCPSTYIEGLPLCCLEAAASGKPMVVSLNGGLTEIVKQKYNGFVIPPGNIESLKEALIKLINDSQLRIRMGQNSRKLAEEYFDIKRNARRTEEIILDACLRRNSTKFNYIGASQ